MNTIPLEAYGFTPALRASLTALERNDEIPARVTAVHKERYALVCERGECYGKLKSATYFNGAAEEFPTTGDFVLLQYNEQGDSIITHTLPRRSYFARKNPTQGEGEQAVAANFDSVFIMQSLNHDLNPKRLERYLTLAWQSGAVPVVVLTKADLVDSYEQQMNEILRVAAGVDVLFAPDESELYPEPQEYQLDPPDIQNQLEGEFRPGHFRGVATVVLKLFNIVQPQVAVFGKKDYQQLMLLRNMTRQLALPIEIVGGETVRADDGLALSSRNGYLTPAERVEAPRLSRVLAKISADIKAGERDFLSLEKAARDELDSHGWCCNYIAIRRQSDLKMPLADEKNLVVLAAARLGKPRLLDNLEIAL